MLDTDTASYASRASHPSVVKRLSALSADDVCISAITRGEMLYGVEISPRRERDAERVSKFLKYMNVVDYPAAAGEEYAQIRAELKRTGMSIGPNDTLIAAHARHLGLTLVTNNMREFSRVPGLLVENWADPA